MLYELMKECRNFFPVKDAAIEGDFCISGGSITLPLLNNQYYIIEGSIMNDGLHKYNAAELLEDESWHGTVIPLSVPKAFLEFADRVEEWRAKYGDPTPFASESFNGYSYSKSIGSTGKQTTWKDAFAADIGIWRRLG